jgi:hypothetical protein
MTQAQYTRGAGTPPAGQPTFDANLNFPYHAGLAHSGCLPERCWLIASGRTGMQSRHSIASAK